MDKVHVLKVTSSSFEALHIHNSAHFKYVFQLSNLMESWDRHVGYIPLISSR
jgi:hypothetical protein